jgi:hypothetical protein
VQSFKLHSVLDALEAATFFLRAGETVPHFFVGCGDVDVLTALDRGAQTRLMSEDTKLLAKLTSSLPEGLVA